MTRSVLLIDRPSASRDAVLASLRERGISAETSDDAFDALARSYEHEPDVVLITDQAGPPSAASLSRILGKRLQGAAIYRLGEPDSVLDPAPSRTKLLAPALDARAIADALAADGQASPARAPDTLDLGAAQVGALSMALLEARFSGVLTLSGDGQEREITWLHGMPVHARSTLASERIGPLLLQMGAVTPEALDAALVRSRDTGIRVGEALVQDSQLSRTELFRALARQVREQLEHACSLSPCKARLRPFVRPAEAIARPPHGLLLRTHPLTVLLRAAGRLPQAAVSNALDRLETRKLTIGAQHASALSFAAELGLALPAADAATLGAARNALREACKEGEVTADVMLVALIAADALRVLEPEAARKGLPSMPPPPVGASLLRALDSRAAFGGLGALASLAPVSDAHTSDRTDEAALEAYLHGAVAPAFARQRALHGAEAELEHAPRALLEAATALGGYAPIDLGAPPGADAVEIEVAAQAKLAQLDLQEPDATDAACARLRSIELRHSIDAARKARLWAAPTKRAEPARASSPPAPAAMVASVAEAAPAAITTAHTAAASESLAEAEPLVLQGKWSEVLDLLARKHTDPAAMPPALRLLQAVALKEAAGSDQRAPLAAQADQIGIRAVSELLGVADDSSMALVLAKRTLRRRPIEWQKPPERRVSVALVVAALAIGALVGFAIDPGVFTLPFTLPW